MMQCNVMPRTCANTDACMDASHATHARVRARTQIYRCTHSSRCSSCRWIRRASSSSVRSACSATMMRRTAMPRPARPTDRPLLLPWCCRLHVVCCMLHVACCMSVILASQRVGHIVWPSSAAGVLLSIGGYCSRQRWIWRISQVELQDVHVSASALLLGDGRGFEIAQVCCKPVPLSGNISTLNHDHHSLSRWISDRFPTTCLIAPSHYLKCP